MNSFAQLHITFLNKLSNTNLTVQKPTLSPYKTIHPPALGVDENLKFVSKYLEIAEDLNIPLAPFDGKKAFICQTNGVMLGVWFDSISQAWSLPADKVHKYIEYYTSLLRIITTQIPFPSMILFS